MSLFASLRASSRSPLLQVLKTSIAAIGAWLLAELLLGQPLPIFAAIAALLVVQPSVNQTVFKGVERSVGVIVGVVLAYAAGAVLGTASWVVLGIIVVALLLSWALKLSPGSSNQIPISAMLVLAIGAQTPEYAADRIIETVIGAIIGLVVNVAIVPPVMVAPARSTVALLAASVAGALDELASALTTPRERGSLDTMLERARALRPLQAKATDDLDRAEDSLGLNPRGARYRVAIRQDRELLARLSILVTRTTGMTRAVHDNYDERLRAEPIVGSIAVEISRASHDVRLLARRLGAGGTSRVGGARKGGADGDAAIEMEPLTAELPALTAPLVIARPDSLHWVLIGSLLEDLRRIREEIIGDHDA